MEIPSHTVLFTQIEARHWNFIENPVLVIWHMSGMIVFDLDMIGIDGAEMARCHCTFPCSTCSAEWSTLLKLYREFSPSSNGHVWDTIKIYRKEAPVMGSAEFSQTA